MKAHRALRLLLPLALSGACSAILGIEDVHPDPKPDGSDGGDPGLGGTGSGNGGTSGTSGTGKGGKGGASGDAGSTGKGGASGDAGGGGDDGGAGTGTGGSGGAPDDTVRGRVITTWLQPVPNVVVMIGDEEATTNADGEFEIPDVADTYDAKFVLNYDVYGNTRTYGWAYLGLTRRDPTLQVYDGLTLRSGDILLEPSNLTGTDFTGRQFLVALGGEHGRNTHEVSLPNGTQTSSTWQGPETMNVTAHGLLFEYNTDELPTVYRSYNQLLAVLSETNQANMTFDVPDETVSSGTVSGTVESATTSDRANSVFLRFESNASMQLVDHYGTSLNPGSFTYTVPNITDGSIEIAASEGTWSYSAAAVAHRDRVATGQNVALVIPNPPQQIAPAEDTTGVDNATIFSWTSTAQNFVWNAENIELTSPYGGMYVVTSEKRVTIPTFPNGFTLIAGDLYTWAVQTHGNATSVDEMTGTEGFADSFAPYAEGPESPRRGDGTYAVSGQRVFTTAP